MKRSADESNNVFIAANQFEGVRSGYFYGMGEQGLGYYLDLQEAQQQSQNCHAKKQSKVSFEDMNQRMVDSYKTLNRVCKMITGKKAEKALSMLGTLVRTEGCLSSRENCTLIVTTLRDLESKNGLTHPGLVATIVAALAANISNLESEEDRADVATWFLSACCPAKLRTDDTYVFVKAITKVNEAIQALEKSFCEAATKRCDAILHCIAVAWPIYLTKPWAKTSVESCVLAAAKKRIHFSSPQQKRLDFYTTGVYERRHGPAARDAFSRSTVRVANSVAHPLRDVRPKNQIFR